MTKIFKKYPIFMPAGIIATLLLLYSLFISTPTYKTESIIFMAEPEAGLSLSAGGFVSDILGSSSNQSIHQLKEYFESDSGANDFSDLLNTDVYLQGAGIDFFSAYKPNIFNIKLSDYLNNKIIKINILSDSGSVKMTTYGFTKEQSFRANIVILLMASNYFDKKQQLNSEIAKVQRLCQLFTDSVDIFADKNIDTLDLISKKDLEDIDSGYKLLSIKANKYLESCQKYSERKTLNDEKMQIVVPDNTLRQINAESLKRTISKIYDDSLDTITMSESLTIITEPVMPMKQESKYSLIKAALALFFSILIFLTFKILLSMRNDFNI